jgi:hypothetical protein
VLAGLVLRQRRCFAARSARNADTQGHLFARTFLRQTFCTKTFCTKTFCASHVPFCMCRFACAVLHMPFCIRLVSRVCRPQCVPSKSHRIFPDRKNSIVFNKCRSIGQQGHRKFACDHASDGFDWPQSTGPALWWRHLQDTRFPSRRTIKLRLQHAMTLLI